VGTTFAAAGLEKVTLDVQSTMKDAKYVDVPVWFYQVRYAVVLVEENTNLS
jgi:hypothetical protein